MVIMIVEYSLYFYAFVVVESESYAVSGKGVRKEDVHEAQKEGCFQVLMERERENGRD